jgi:hypothetical protein
LLWIPWVAPLVSHAIVHVLFHWGMHHEERFQAVMALGAWLLVLAVPALAVRGRVWGMGDAALMLLISQRLLGKHHH